MRLRDFLLGFVIGILLMGVLPASGDHGGLGNHASAYCQSPSVATKFGFVHNTADGTRQVIYQCISTNNALGGIT